ncbi:pyrroline-5-carboxylate reductase [Rhizobium lusitanum]|uniref:Pyrroline-5-carboxylate reductase n=1 Tax=Rhizobium lusitanum TaxID=293958 RepID=A0A6L9UF27_9HYPH|nr:pyrroline-5-carboxylate reductase [Rhizobium lusitanum]NEI73991.1 pyrroline-5-carboxylate reductase [Rhizobium lusitanum]
MSQREMTGELLLIGYGNMGQAMLRSWLEGSFVQSENVHIVEPAEELRAQSARLGMRTYDTAASLNPAFRPEIVIFAIKPQVMPRIMPDYRRHATKAVTISIAAGISISLIEEGLGKVPAIRAMPNIPTAIGKGSTVVFANDLVRPEQKLLAGRLLSTGGAVHQVLDEALIDAATAISGSGPTYVFHFIEGLFSVATQLGLPSQIALSLAKETVYGAGALAIAESATPQELRRQVTSPGGTTEAALRVLMQGGALQNLLQQAACAVHRRAIELAQN